MADLLYDSKKFAAVASAAYDESWGMEHLAMTSAVSHGSLDVGPGVWHHSKINQRRREWLKEGFTIVLRSISRSAASPSRSRFGPDVNRRIRMEGKTSIPMCRALGI